MSSKKTDKKNTTEKSFMAVVRRIAKEKGWRVYHPAISLHPTERGYPDLTLVRERVIFAELKTDNGTLTETQVEWINALRLAGQEVYVWRPCQIEDIIAILSTWKHRDKDELVLTG